MKINIINLNYNEFLRRMVENLLGFCVSGDGEDMNRCDPKKIFPESRENI